MLNSATNIVTELAQTPNKYIIIILTMIISSLGFIIIGSIFNEFVEYNEDDPRKIQLNQISLIELSGNLIGGALALTAIAMSIITWGFSQLDISQSEITSDRIKQLIQSMYLITILSITATVSSIIHLIYDYIHFFYITLILIYIMSLSIIVSTNQLVTPIFGGPQFNDN